MYNEEKLNKFNILMLLAEIVWLPYGIYWRVSNSGFTRAQNN